MKIISYLILFFLISTQSYSQEMIITESGPKTNFVYKGGRVGIGTSNPSSTLTVMGVVTSKSTINGNSFSVFSSGDGNSYMNFTGGEENSRLGVQFDGGSKFSFYKNGNFINHQGGIGIGGTPVSKLDIQDNTSVYTKAENANALVIRRTNSPEVNDKRMIGLSITLDNSDRVHTNNQKSVGIFAQSTSAWSNRVDMLFYTRNYEGDVYGERMRIKGNGEVGIGTTNTDGYKLSVNGKVRATEVKVYTGWADYVFEEDYKLKPLEEVEKHIKEHKHLPDVPSAKEVEENGINVGETEAMLLRKIEELTLYIIQQQKEINALKKINEEVKELKLLINRK